MKKLFIKTSFYLLLILLISEIIIRVFHLTKDTPNRFLDEHDVEKWVPNQNGFEVTGIRRQNIAEFNINNSGFNSYREFNPTKEKTEIALVGDSFIQGFHQDYDDSIGKKIENSIPNIEVYEYGYAGYDFADQLHLINAYKNDFDLIDQVIVYLNFEEDLGRGEYKVIQDRLALQTPLNNTIKKCKLLVYCKSIGFLDPPKKFVSNLINTIKGNKNSSTTKTKQKDKTDIYIDNFKNLVKLYGFNKSKFFLLLDSSKTPNKFLTYLSNNNYKIIDYNNSFQKAKHNTTLIYDQHWNNYGREFIASEISNALFTKN